MPSSGEQAPRAFILLVDDDKEVLELAVKQLDGANLGRVATLTDSRDVLPFLDSCAVDVVVLDLYMPYWSGLQLLPEILRRKPGLPVLMMTATLEVETAVECMKHGAFDYLVKPVDPQRLVGSVRNALRLHSLQKDMAAMKRSLLAGGIRRPEIFSGIVTVNRQMQAIFQYIEAVAHSPEPVLIVGETGVGKEGIAQAIHQARGGSGRMVAVNVAGLDDNVFADTLFGHRKGAFTGADAQRDGMLARAEGGTIFLDEIGDLSEASQIKLLRLLQEREYYPLGEDQPRTTTARVVMATNIDLTERMRQGRFRADLYFRLTVHEIRVPPLRERKEDLPLLVEHFFQEAAKSLNKPVPTPPREILDLLDSYDFPGNIRELRSMVFDAVASHRSRVLSLGEFKRHMTKQNAVPLSSALVVYPGRLPTLREATAHVIREAMTRANGNQGVAASFLGISRQALNRRLGGLYGEGEAE
ncbi:MAG: sigma-54-dependent Fis family transcriptional regulator [Magnetococcales bacterium]|nr:sigma-54-dependent Fis family transcriptional regulator [Magnetococcales bacterium]MBF0309610.1 sigma-54-dependent Fis family transcriptional regulator [Magnetococcales bacterium]